MGSFIEFEWPFGLEKDKNNIITVEGTKIDGTYFNEQQTIIVDNNILPKYQLQQFHNQEVLYAF